jgi:hypothetical protein
MPPFSFFSHYFLNQFFDFSVNCHFIQTDLTYQLFQINLSCEHFIFISFITAEISCLVLILYQTLRKYLAIYDKFLALSYFRIISFHLRPIYFKYHFFV